MLWQTGVRQLLFCLPAERAHYLSMGAFSALAIGPVARIFRNRYTVSDPRLQAKLFGLDFQNPVGLAAGFDKDARWFHKLSSLGFSHVEVGTITGKPQPGNPQPRLFRLPVDQAIINRMGFNNHGADAAARRLATVGKADPQDILGINIGKTKIVPLAESTRDYLFSFERLFAFADYFTINVSSPNTPGLRELQNREYLLELLSALTELNVQLANDHATKRKPILLKIAPDVTNYQLDDIVSMLREVKLDGIIATNTTISRDGLKTPDEKLAAIGAGGLSGRPLTTRSRQVVAELFQRVGKAIPIVGVGGIMSGEDAWQMIRAGASLVQVYTGFVYGGPAIVRNINRHLLKRLEEHGMENIQHAVGGGKQFD
jgi:dihydroorotate dehydrogenase